MKNLVFEVFEIKRRCVYKDGNRIVIKGVEIDFKRMNDLCIHTQASLMHYAAALREYAEPVKLEPSKEIECTYIWYLDPGKPYTEDETVIFSVSSAECIKIASVVEATSNFIKLAPVSEELKKRSGVVIYKADVYQTVFCTTKFDTEFALLLNKWHLEGQLVLGGLG